MPHGGGAGPRAVGGAVQPVIVTMAKVVTVLADCMEPEQLVEAAERVGELSSSSPAEQEFLVEVATALRTLALEKAT